MDSRITAKYHDVIAKLKARQDEALEKAAQYETQDSYLARAEGFLQKAQRAERSETNLKRIWENTPPYFTWKLIKIPDDKELNTSKLRKEFEKKVRPMIFKILPRIAEGALIKMGLSEEQVMMMQRHETNPRMCRSKPEKTSLTLDHVLDLNLGGQNNERNIRVVANHVNWFRAYLIDIQRQQADPESETVMLLDYKDSEPVPLINPDGKPFAREFTQDFRVMRQRMIDDLGVDLIL